MDSKQPPSPASHSSLHASSLRHFLRSEAAGGILLIIATCIALVIANSSCAPLYFKILDYHLCGLSVKHWINDGLMSIFFLLVGLEIKRELQNGQLATWHLRRLPFIAALGGVIVPALIFTAINWQSPSSLKGWAVPVATDIAFALGVMALLGSRVPASLKVFLTALAIIDDLGAIIIIAVFYTSGLSVYYLATASIVMIALCILNRFNVQKLWLYFGFGTILWYFILKSGIHPSVAGVLLAFTIPDTNHKPEIETPLLRAEHGIQPYVAFFIIPVFGLANSGLTLDGMSFSSLFNPASMGVGLGLLLGKQFGVFGFSWLAVRFKWANRPNHSSWVQFYGVALLCGIGFTMSLFISNLAFVSSPTLQDAIKLGILAGSVASAICGWCVLRLNSKTKQKEM